VTVYEDMMRRICILDGDFPEKAKSLRKTLRDMSIEYASKSIDERNDHRLAAAGIYINQRKMVIDRRKNRPISWGVLIGRMNFR
jgi:hypothetical protein